MFAKLNDMAKEFFNSKLKKICYHGTYDAPFDVLDKSKIQKDPEEGDSGYFGWGFYLTTDRAYAEEYGDTVLEFYVDIQNPFTFKDVDYEDLIDYIFEDSGKKLTTRLQDTMYAIKLIGTNKKLEFRNDNPSELNKRCLDVYHKYNDNITKESIPEIEALLVDLAKVMSNWMNGAFLQFGKELFHYFTFNGYDGVIALGGKEVVVYETKQLDRIKAKEGDVEEDLDLDVVDTVPVATAWYAKEPLVGRYIKNVKTGKVGQVQTQSHSRIEVLFDGNKHFTPFYFFNNFITGEVTMTTTNDMVVTDKYVLLPSKPETKQEVTEEIDLDVIDVPNIDKFASDFTNKVYRNLSDNEDITSFEIQTKLNPLRQDPCWYDNYTILWFRYKDLLEVLIYAGGEMEMWFDEDDEVYTPRELEERGIYTDEDLDRQLDETGAYDNGGLDNNTCYFGFTITPLKNNPRGDDFYSYDMGYDDMYSTSEFVDDNGSLDAFINQVVSNFISDNPEYFEETEPEDDEEEINESTESETKHITKEQVLKDIISVFGNISVDKLTDAVYLLPNGKILDTKGPYDKSQHENIAKYLFDKYGIKDLSVDNGSKFMDDIGAVRITPWIPGIVIPEHYLTEKQEDILYNIIVKLQPKVTPDTPFMISSLDGESFISISKITNPEDIITSILGYQVLGVLKEGIKRDTRFLNHLR